MHIEKVNIAKFAHRIIPILYEFKKNDDHLKRHAIEMIEEFMPSETKCSVIFNNCIYSIYCIIFISGCSNISKNLIINKMEKQHI